jgi:hypothetical protein
MTNGKLLSEHKEDARKRPPKWVYIIVSLIVIILALSLLPGGRSLPLLIVPILGWTATIYLFRNFKIVRLLVILSGVIIAIGILVAMFANNGLSSLGY